ncbi:unnamed protein product [Toxocara canis]|uniref:Uncharacterized protein n=1 Tax=Toxocara canis TaxID=6265 RepID=A0A183URF1_TOXCA|nr:unnamed protein product [Toxocara canis]
MSRVLLVLLVSLLLLFTRTNGSELQREFRVSESVPIGHIIGYISGSALIGLKPTYYIVYPDSTGQVENVSYTSFFFCLFTNFTKRSLIFFRNEFQIIPSYMSNANEVFIFLMK